MKISRLLIFLVFILVSCSQESDGENPGSCRLECSGRKAASSEAKLKLLGFEDGNYSCSATVAGPVTVRFMVYENVADGLYTGVGQRGEDAAEADEGALLFSKPTIRPIGGIGFEPWLNGAMSITNTAGEFKSGSEEIDPAKYAGVVTPSSDWCSDSCGVMTYQFWPECTDGNEVQATVLSGGINNTDAVSTYSVERTEN